MVSAPPARGRSEGEAREQAPGLPIAAGRDLERALGSSAAASTPIEGDDESL